MAKTSKSTRRQGRAASGGTKSEVIRPAAFMMPADLNGLLLGGATNKAMETMMSKSKNQFEKISQDAADYNRESVEAFVKAGSIFAKGFEDIMRTSVALAQSAAEKQAQFVKDAMSSKTLNELTEVQNKIAQASFNEFMAGATKISEMSVKLMTEAAEPLNEQANKAIQKAQSAMAA